MPLKDRVESVRQRIEEACQRSGRTPSAITLVAVTKTVPAPLIQELIALGITDLGENRVQEAREKQTALGSKLKAEGQSLQPLRPDFQNQSRGGPASSLQQIRWHLIGHLQSNKAKHAVELFDVIHSVDSLELVQELERQCAKRNRSIDVMIQVNVTGEATKSGCRPEMTEALAQAARQQPHLRLTGLMTIAPYIEDPETIRPVFRHLRVLRDQVGSSLQLPTSSFRLSMGMSHDFEVAIEEGADIVRIGTAIFGGRGQGAGGKGN